MERLSDREKEILKAIIHSYILTAESISSKLIVENFKFNISSATIRNVMCHLEEKGYIKQLHKSAGRMPTDNGYRYYVENLIQLKILTKKEEEKIDKEYFQKKREINFILQQASKALSSLTNYTGLISLPALKKEQLSEIKLVKLDDFRIVIIAISTNGIVKDTIYNLHDFISDTELNILIMVLNLYLKGEKLDKIKQILNVHETYISYKKIYNLMIDVSKLDIFSFESDAIYWDGRENLTEHPEFKNYERLSDFLKILDKRSGFANVLKDSLNNDGVNAYIGKEGTGIEDCCLVSSSYSIGDEKIGVLGVVGPNRMKYSSVISAVGHMANRISQYLTGIFRR